MVHYAVARLLWLIPTLLAMALVTFVVMHATPGSPLDPIAEGANPLSPEAQRNLAAHYGLDRPLPEQFVIFVANALRGDFGNSFVYKTRTVGEILRTAFPVLLLLGTMAFAVATVGGLVLGVLAAVHQNRVWDYVSVSLATFGVAVPNFVLAVFFIVLFSLMIPVFPTGGWDSPHNWVLPTLTLALAPLGIVARYTRASMRDVIRADYTLTAGAKGLGEPGLQQGPLLPGSHDALRRSHEVQRRLPGHPYVAEKVAVNKDGSVWTFTIRKDSKWSDGGPCSARDFEYSWKRQRSQFPPDFLPTPNATHVEFDFLALLLDALAARGLEYTVVAAHITNDIEAPALLPGGACCREIRFTDREVILALASRHHNDPLELSNAQTGTFGAQLPFPLPNGSVYRQRRGWAAVDVRTRGAEFRFVTTHLEPEGVGNAVQEAQGREVVAGPANTPLPVVFVCDCNSRADGTGTMTYVELLSAGFDDTWRARQPHDDGLTCCQAADLRNAESLFDRRIDFVLARGEARAQHVELVGERLEDRLESGLWPSDHAGVVATLQFRP